MQRFLDEIRQRGVLRAAGLYIALVWLLLQIADIVFPAFGIPDEAVKYILYGAVALFPVVLVSSWFYELTSSGLVKEADLETSGIDRRQLNRRTAMITIGVLAAALAISVVFNVQQVTEPDAAPETPDTVTLLIADAVNKTGDPIFSGALEQALSIGLEGASFINSAPRHIALQLADRYIDGEGLGLERAQLIALREAVQLVVQGTIERSGGGFELSLKAIDAGTGEVVTSASARAEDKAGVLQAVATLTDKMRVALGDVSLAEDPERGSFTAASLEAVSYYNQAQSLAREGKDAEAVPLYEKAIEADPDFGRAYSGWALSEFNLGHQGKSEALWRKTLTMLDDMNERERYRTLGLYYMLVTNNLGKAIENYRLLVEKFPADGIGHNNLAVAYFTDRQFDRALEEGEKALAIYPKNTVLMSNKALYAMYSGDFELADKAADQAIAADPEFHKPYLAKAIAALARGDFEAARKSYELMSRQGDLAASLAASGLADVALMRGRPAEAVDILTRAIREDEAVGNQRGAQRKRITLAQALLAAGDHKAARESLAGLEETDSISLLVPLGRTLVMLGDLDAASELSERLAARLSPADRAAGDLLRGNVLLARGQLAPAVDALTESIERVDSWLARFDRGRAYAIAGSYAEALSEFELCQSRTGEASALFLDDQPTLHYSTALYYWLGRTRQELGISQSARESLQRFLELQESVDSDEVVDARQRLEALDISP